jgi:hypothetical protein
MAARSRLPDENRMPGTQLSGRWDRNVLPYTKPMAMPMISGLIPTACTTGSEEICDAAEAKRATNRTPLIILSEEEKSALSTFINSIPPYY